MRFDCISAEEARRKYAEADNKDEMIQVLADLMCTTNKEMRAFLGVQTAKPQRGNRVDPDIAVRMFHEGASYTEIAEACGTTKAAVSGWMRRHGFQKTGNQKEATKKSLEYRMELYRQGLIDREIAERVGISKGRIWQWRHDNGLPPNGTCGGKRESGKKGWTKKIPLGRKRRRSKNKSLKRGGESEK